MRSQIREAIQGGLPTVAECGGFLFLQRELETREGKRYPMCGVFPGRGFPRGKLGRFGYVELTARRSGLLLEAGETIRGHEFHYWDVDVPGEDFHAQKPLSKRGWECVHTTPTLYAGFPHLHFWANPEAAARFVRAAGEGRKKGERLDSSPPLGYTVWV
jgi:cobyrinic acid a,c-diamide synthase